MLQWISFYLLRRKCIPINLEVCPCFRHWAVLSFLLLKEYPSTMWVFPVPVCRTQRRWHFFLQCGNQLMALRFFQKRLFGLQNHWPHDQSWKSEFLHQFVIFYQFYLVNSVTTDLLDFIIGQQPNTYHYLNLIRWHVNYIGN